MIQRPTNINPRLIIPFHSILFPKRKRLPNKLDDYSYLVPLGTRQTHNLCFDLALNKVHLFARFLF